jgi:hypothetical protein
MLPKVWWCCIVFLSIQLAWWQVRACMDALLDISPLIYTKLDLRFKVLMAIIIVFLIFGFWCRVDVLVNASISEKHTVFIFQGLEVTRQGSRGLI